MFLLQQVVNWRNTRSVKLKMIDSERDSIVSWTRPALMRVAWPQMEHIVVVRQKGDTVLPSVPTVPTPTTKEGASPASSSSVSSPEPSVHIGWPCLSRNLFNKNPIDLLVVKEALTWDTQSWNKFSMGETRQANQGYSPTKDDSWTLENLNHQLGKWPYHEGLFCTVVSPGLQL